MKPRIYIDTSIIGGCFDEEFKEDSNRLIEMALNGDVVLLLSDVLMEEISRAPEAIQLFAASLPDKSIEILNSQVDDIELRKRIFIGGSGWSCLRKRCSSCCNGDRCQSRYNRKLEL